MHLFDANIFYPAKHALAFSEHVFTLSMMGAPLWLGASPVLVYNLLLLAGFTLTGWVTSLVVHRWTGDWTAGILAGSVMAFNAHSLTRLPHLHASHMEFMLLTLLALDRVLRQPTTGNALLLAVSFVLQALTSNYHMVFTLFAIAAAVAVQALGLDGPALPPRCSCASHRRRRLRCVHLSVPASVYRARVDYGLTRSLEEVSTYTTSLDDYLPLPAACTIRSGAKSSPITRARFFPGVLPLGLALVTITSDTIVRDLRARMCLAIGIVGFLPVVRHIAAGLFAPLSGHPAAAGHPRDGPPGLPGDCCRGDPVGIWPRFSPDPMERKTLAARGVDRCHRSGQRGSVEGADWYHPGLRESPPFTTAWRPQAGRSSSSSRSTRIAPIS